VASEHLSMKPSIPDAIRPALGLRAWDVVDGPALESVYRGVVWPRNQRLVAECLDPADLFEGYKPRHKIKRWWLPGEYETVEKIRAPTNKHLAPHRGCSCGIYGAWELGEAHLMGAYMPGVLTFKPVTPKYSNRPKVFGAVAGWGRVVRGSKGFRAQFAKVVAFFIPRDVDHQGIEELGELYEVPIVDRDNYNIEWKGA
jgi:hypothetical protein